LEDFETLKRSDFETLAKPSIVENRPHMAHQARHC